MVLTVDPVDSPERWYLIHYSSVIEPTFNSNDGRYPHWSIPAPRVSHHPQFSPPSKQEPEHCTEHMYVQQTAGVLYCRQQLSSCLVLTKYKLLQHQPDSIPVFG